MAPSYRSVMGEAAGTSKVGVLEVDQDTYRAWLGGRPLRLSRTEIELLAFLLANGHKVSSREELSEQVGLARGRSVDVVLSRFRRTARRAPASLPASP